MTTPSLGQADSFRTALPAAARSNLAAAGVAGLRPGQLAASSPRVTWTSRCSPSRLTVTVTLSALSAGTNLPASVTK